MNRITTGVIISLLIVAAALAWTTDHYHGNAIRYKDQRDTATHSLKLANATITDMQTRQRDVAALDAKYTKELADAKAENDALRDDVAAGRRRLHVNATCPAVQAGKSTTAPGVDNAARPRLADSAQRDYFTLRERVKTMQKQLEATQQYISEQCMQ
ncbi:lysis protein [Salmonella enterica]|uniref:Lysis protein n=2 Tax=Salmonella enterica TaxID=28901 RepID=A0A5U7RSZ7_SALER|nr:lysis protein [Salmonella enterica]EBZ2512356.1 lysis protein [Salmonella enterica subsp. enterica serovar Cerro]ECC3916038.1 lysis protein [Salmonella enterica subsp. diarizonae]EEE9945987.1 lysis protein [Salmonella enterica subsp. enterica serovar Uzaramo]ELD8110850.1 lysis protein [Salmonella enterica subsp. enterica serovar Benin]